MKRPLCSLTIALIIGVVVPIIINSPQPQYNSILTGALYYDELLEAHSTKSFEFFKSNKLLF